MITSLSSFSLPGWTGLKISGRVDAFNDRRVIQMIEASAQNSVRLAIDLSTAEFLSLQTLKYLVELSRELGRKGGELALVRPTHHVRRQIEIFLGTKVFNVYESQEHLQLGYFVQPRAEFQTGGAEAYT